MPDMPVGHAAGGGLHRGLQGATRVLPGVPLPTLRRPGLRLASLWFVLSGGLTARRSGSPSAATLRKADRVALASRSRTVSVGVAPLGDSGAYLVGPFGPRK